MSQPLLEVKNLYKYFKTKSGMLHAVEDLSFEIEAGKTLGIVGESGCGKSTMGRCLLRLHEPDSGQILFDGKDILTVNKQQMRALRKDMQMIFQDPFASLNPRKTVSELIGEPMPTSQYAEWKDGSGCESAETDGDRWIGSTLCKFVST